MGDKSMGSVHSSFKHQDATVTNWQFLKHFEVNVVGFLCKHFPQRRTILGRYRQTIKINPF